MRWLIGQFGLERLRAATVVLPRPTFFPDRFEHRLEDAYPMFDRICHYMGVATYEVDLQFYEQHEILPNGEQHYGTAGLFIGTKPPFQIWVEKSNLKDPLALAATIAHELAHVHLLGHGLISADEEDQEPLTDLTTVFFGIGVITANAVLREHSWHAGTVSSWSMQRAGYLTMPILGYALALFAHARNETSPAWSRELRSDVHGPWKQGVRYLDVAEDNWLSRRD